MGSEAAPTARPQSTAVTPWRCVSRGAALQQAAGKGSTQRAVRSCDEFWVVHTPQRTQRARRCGARQTKDRKTAHVSADERTKRVRRSLYLPSCAPLPCCTFAPLAPLFRALLAPRRLDLDCWPSSPLLCCVRGAQGAPPSGDNGVARLRGMPRSRPAVRVSDARCARLRWAATRSWFSCCCMR